jgi:hypothetical protein
MSFFAPSRSEGWGVPKITGPQGCRPMAHYLGTPWHEGVAWHETLNLYKKITLFSSDTCPAGYPLSTRITGKIKKWCGGISENKMSALSFQKMKWSKEWNSGHFVFQNAPWDLTCCKWSSNYTKNFFGHFYVIVKAWRWGHYQNSEYTWGRFWILLTPHLRVLLYLKKWQGTWWIVRTKKPAKDRRCLSYF